MIDESRRNEVVAMAIAAAVAEHQALRTAIAVAAALAGEQPGVQPLPSQTSDVGFWGRAAMAHYPVVPLGLLRRA